MRLDPRGRWPADVALWRVAVPADAQAWARLSPRLSDDERERATRYRRDEDRLRFAATRAALRAHLAAITGVPPLRLRLIHGQHGRPVLHDGPPLSFNVSHAGPHALIAVSTAREVGVDVEMLDPSLDWRPLLDTVCTRDERCALEMCAEPLRAPAFLRCWTAKEALLKALGLGITQALQHVAVDPFAHGVQSPRVVADSVARGAAALRFYWLDAADGLDGAVGCIAFADAARRGDGAALVTT